MSLDDRAAAGSGRPVLAILLAVVFLAIIGGSVGVIFGARELGDRPAAVGDGRAIVETPESPAPVNSPAAARPARSPAPSRSAGSPTGRPAREECPAPTAQNVADRGGTGPLRLRLYIETALSEVWICETTGGQLWYQGHRKSGPGRTYPTDDLVEGTNALLVGSVSALPDNRYEAVNGTTSYAVSAKELVITGPEPPPEIQPVLNRYP